MAHPQDPSYKTLFSYFLAGHFQPNTPLAAALAQMPTEDKPLQFKLLRALLHKEGPGQKAQDDKIVGLLDAIEHKNISNDEWNFILFCLSDSGKLSKFIFKDIAGESADFVDYLMQADDINKQKLLINAFLTQCDDPVKLVSFCQKFRAKIPTDSWMQILRFCIKKQAWISLERMVEIIPSPIMLMPVNQMGQTLIDLAFAEKNLTFLQRIQHLLAQYTGSASSSSFMISYGDSDRYLPLMEQVSEYIAQLEQPPLFGISSSSLKDADSKLSTPRVKIEPGTKSSNSSAFFSSRKGQSYCQFLDELGSNKESAIEIDDEDEDFFAKEARELEAAAISGMAKPEPL